MNKLKGKTEKRLNIVLIILGAVLILLIGYNIHSFCKGENGDLFKSSIVDILTLGVEAYLVCYITEKINDTRRLVDCVDHIITEIESMINDEKFFSMDRKALIMQTSCANKIKYLKDANIDGISEDIVFIEGKITDIRDLYSNHSQSSEALESVSKDFDKRRSDIIDKCDKIRIAMFS